MEECSAFTGVADKYFPEPVSLDTSEVSYQPNDRAEGGKQPFRRIRATEAARFSGRPKPPVFEKTREHLAFGSVLRRIRSGHLRRTLNTRYPLLVAARETVKSGGSQPSNQWCSESDPRLRCTTSQASDSVSRRGNQNFSIA